MPIASLKPTVSHFQPLGDRLVVRRLDGPKEIGGILLPESQVKIGLIRAQVLLVGTKVSDHHGITPGSIVHVPPQLGYMKVIMDDVPVDIVPVEQVQAKEEAA